MAEVKETTSEQNTIEVEAYENQRYFPLKGWGVSMLPTDRWKWSSRDGRVERRIDDKAPAPHGYGWVGGWELDRPAVPDPLPQTGHPSKKKEVDPEGWMYAFDFPAEYHPRMGGHSWVRRRRWVRKVALVDQRLARRVGRVVENGKFVLVDEPGVGSGDVDVPGGDGTTTNSTSASGVDLCDLSSHSPSQKGHGQQRFAASGTATATVDSCGFSLPEEERSGMTTPIGQTPAGVVTAGGGGPRSSIGSAPTTPSVHEMQQQQLLAASATAKEGSEEYRKHKVLTKWFNNHGQRQGSCVMHVHEIHLCQEAKAISCSLHYSDSTAVGHSAQASAAQQSVQEQGTQAATHIHTSVPITCLDPNSSAIDLDKGIDGGFQQYFLINNDHHPIVLRANIEYGQGRRQGGEMHMSLRNPPPGAKITYHPSADGRFSEHGEATVLLCPPPSGSGAEDSLYKLDTLGTARISWVYDLRDETMYANKPALEFCEICGRTQKQCKCSKDDLEKKSETATNTSIGDEHDIPAPPKKAGRLVLRIISGSHLIDHAEHAESADGTPAKYYRKKKINPYVVLHYDARNTPTPAQDVVTTEQLRHQIVKTQRTEGEANDASDVAWGETLVVDVAHAESEQYPLSLEVWDHNTFATNKFMGKCFIDPIQQCVESPTDTSPKFGSGGAAGPALWKLLNLRLSPRTDETDPSVLAIDSLGSLTVRMYWMPYNL